jgi:hypothetical protein
MYAPNGTSCYGVWWRIIYIYIIDTFSDTPLYMRYALHWMETGAHCSEFTAKKLNATSLSEAELEALPESLHQSLWSSYSVDDQGH